MTYNVFGGTLTLSLNTDWLTVDSCNVDRLMSVNVRGVFAVSQVRTSSSLVYVDPVLYCLSTKSIRSVSTQLQFFTSVIVFYIS